MPLVVCLVGCASTPVAPAVGDASEPESEGLDSGLPSAADRALDRVSLSADSAVAQLQDALEQGVVEPWSLRAAYRDALAHAEGGCPTFVESPDAFVVPRQWSDTCTTPSGWTFSGNGTYEERREEEGRAFFMDIASFVITRPDGTVFSGSGGFVVQDEPEDGGWSGLTAGTWSDTAGSGWLAAGVSGAVDVFALGSGTEVDGGLQVAGVSVFFDEVMLSAGGAIDGGRLGLRDPSGDWWWLTPGADGCGPLLLADAEVGTGCVDPAALTVDSEAAP